VRGVFEKEGEWREGLKRCKYEMKINYLDLFSGIGGFALGMQMAGIEFENHYFSEIDPYAIKVYKKHYPGAVELGDVTKIDGTKLGRIDIISGGFPCQDISQAGHCEGIEGLRSGLFSQIVGIERNDDGLSEGMDRLKSVGNAVVPQVVAYLTELIVKPLLQDLELMASKK
jgi:site-specific DNA-cytosine methylase